MRVEGVGVCGSDVALLIGEREAPLYPWTIGHEAVGVVVGSAES